jgi:hypothetical protein
MKRAKPLARKIANLEYLAFIVTRCLWIVFIFAASSQSTLPGNAQNEIKVQSIDSQALDEPGCPISIQSLRAELEVDPFQAPVAIRVYLNYKNDSPKTVEAVKFRFRLQDADGAHKLNYLASDTHIVPPGESAQEKLRHEGIPPQAKRLLLRVLQIRFSDQSTWQSAHQPPAQTESSGGDEAPVN